MGKKLKVLMLALTAVCAFGVVSAAGAQAAGPVFTVNGVTSGSEALSSTVTVTSTNLTLKVPSTLSIVCKKAELDEGTIKVGTNEGTVKSITFFECEVLDKNGAATTCKVQGGTPAKNGEIHTKPVKLALSTGPAKEHLVTFEPEEEIFVEVNITECALEGKTKIKGTAVAKSLSGETLTASQELESSEAIQNASGKELLYGTKKSSLTGKIDVKLASGRTWDVSGW
jgi:hypothetical protein